MVNVSPTRTTIDDVLDDFEDRGYAITSVTWDSRMISVYDDNGNVTRVPSRTISMSIIFSNEHGAGWVPEQSE